MLESDFAATMVDLLRMRADRDAHACGYTFCSDEGERTTLGVRDLAGRAQAIAAELQKISRPGDRVLLVYPAGLEFISAFFGCLFAGVLPVPATYPRPRRPMPRLAAISTDCGADIALTTARTLKTLAFDRSGPELRTLRWVATDLVADDLAANWRDPQRGPDDLAFLQYTSGSTSQPKGVMVSHRNLMHNLEMIRQGFDIAGIHADGLRPVGVSWLPAYHDMGLIGGILNTLYNAFHTTLMSPTSFLQRPLSWLQLITSERGTITGAPNFAFELCIAKTTPAERATLDLSSVRLALCAAEPIRADTLVRFAEAFAGCGFRAEAFYPCYGLAESTLLAAGRNGPARLSLKSVCRSSLARHQVRPTESCGSEARTLVGCGNGLVGQKIAIVDPQEGRRLPPDQVGEIWIRGASVARGYWKRPDDTEHLFEARIVGEDESTYLRSGDLGFVCAGQLFVTGRLKDVIIIRGSNHYPQDIERTAGSAHPMLQPDGVAVVSVEVEKDERLVVILEVNRSQRPADFTDVFRAVRRAVAAEHELDTEAIVLIRQASLPRTTSGKVQRSLCKERYLRGELKVVAEWSSRSSVDRVRSATTLPPQDSADSAHGNGNGHGRASFAGYPSPDSATPLDHRPAFGSQGAWSPDMLCLEESNRLAERIEARLIEWIMARCDLKFAEVDRHKPFVEYGVDSLAAVELSAELEQWLQVQIPAVAAWNYPTPEAMSRYLAEQVRGARGAPAEKTPDVSASPGATEFEDLLADIEGLSESDVQAALIRIIPDGQSR